MKARALINVFLLILVVGLAFWLYFKPWREIKAEFRIASLAPTEVKQIRIEKPGASPVALEKGEREWRLAAPFSARADPVKVEALLELLAAKSVERLPASDLARYELDRPQARIAFDDKVIALGMLNPLSNEQYVASEQAVYLIAPRYARAALAPPGSFASSRLLAENEKPVRFEFPDFKVFEGETGWRVEPGKSGLSQDDVNRWVQEFRLATARSVAPAGSHETQSTFKITLTDGREIAFDVIEREREVVIARGDEKLAFHFGPDAAARLLSPPGKSTVP
jgi:hypothetical protein